MKTVGIGFIVSAIVVFYLMFFKLAPYVISLLPVNDWTPILGLLMYVLVAYLGGIGIPIVLLIFGVMSLKA